MKRFVLFAIFTLLLMFGSACGTCQSSVGRSFTVGKDSFAFRNDLQWSYEFADNGKVVTRDVDPPPKYPLRCFPTVRTAREFFYHAQFAPDLPRETPEGYARLAKEVVKRNSRCPAPPEERIIIPGYADLFTFSVDHEAILREACGGPLWSYLQRGNWRMIFPVTRWRNRRTARQLAEEIRDGRVPIVHFYLFPKLTVNHSLLLCGVKEEGGELFFEAYDPNNPGRPASLSFRAKEGAFLFERNQYFAGGRVSVYEVFSGWFY